MTDDPRELLKQATALKREKRYDEAVTVLRRATALPTPPNGAPLMIEERLRLPMYLQLAGHGDEGWRELNLLTLHHGDIFSQTIIAEQMAVFLRKEGKFKQAILLAAWGLCMARRRDISNLQAILEMNAESQRREAEWAKLGLPAFPQSPVVGTAPDGTPIRDVGYPPLERRIATGYGEDTVRATLRRDLAKLKLADDGTALVTEVAAYVQSPPPYDMSALRTILARHVP